MRIEAPDCCHRACLHRSRHMPQTLGRHQAQNAARSGRPKGGHAAPVGAAAAVLRDGEPWECKTRHAVLVVRVLTVRGWAGDHSLCRPLSFEQLPLALADGRWAMREGASHRRFHSRHWRSVVEARQLAASSAAVRRRRTGPAERPPIATQRGHARRAQRLLTGSLTHYCSLAPTVTELGTRRRAGGSPRDQINRTALL